MPWKLTVRVGPRVTRQRFDSLPAALAAAEGRARELAADTSKEPVDARIRRFEPVEQVAARVELSGPERLIPSVRGGLDVRGDGSAEAYLGRVRRKLVQPRGNETPYRALRRVLMAERKA